MQSDNKSKLLEMNCLLKAMKHWLFESLNVLSTLGNKWAEQRQIYQIKKTRNGVSHYCLNNLLSS
jgi:hypothetical protein